ncbi:class IV adenylate cyclase [Rubinisphaera margarita]|uniref:class IV adenylate cyclase n=1 Tax=Rubinisphaera margarita TaxID=2909586 RepID=UPI001EE7DE8D|nr:class IV adenylate cyclase [Rubinisphaera margarita]MCG6154694.1 class IV adenylate cyclase [Rubinisphaera margarita]
MHYEVEVKYPVHDLDVLRQSLDGLGAVCEDSVEQEDLYFGHPLRDFASTDEAFRIRRTDNRNGMTYKGPLLDQETKSRQEVEVDLGDGVEQNRKMQVILEQLGFSVVHCVKKSREIYHLPDEDREVEIVIDHVDGLGTYVELECVSEESQFEETRKWILDLAQRLHLGPKVERRSYLRLLLDRLAESTAS